jgi:hypothetical protein
VSAGAGRDCDEMRGMSTLEPDEIGQEAEFVDDAVDDDEVSPQDQLLLDRKELNELGLELDNPDQFADDE